MSVINTDVFKFGYEVTLGKPKGSLKCRISICAFISDYHKSNPELVFLVRILGMFEKPAYNIIKCPEYHRFSDWVHVNLKVKEGDTLKRPFLGRIPFLFTDDDRMSVFYSEIEFKNEGMMISIPCHSPGGILITDDIIWPFGRWLQDRVAKREQGYIAMDLDYMKNPEAVFGIKGLSK